MKDYKKILEGLVNIINNTEKSDIGFANICTFIAATNQTNAASIACQDTSEEPEKCSVEYIGKVVIEPNIKEQEVIDL